MDAEAIDGRFALLLARAASGPQFGTSTSTAGSLFAEYIRQRLGTRKAFGEMISQAEQQFMAETGLSFVPKREPTLPVPPTPFQAPSFEPSTTTVSGPKLATQANGSPSQPKGKRALQLIGLGLVVLAVVGVWSSLASNSSASEATETDSSVSTHKSTAEVLYEVEGTAEGTNVTLASGTGTIQQNNKAVPLGNKATGKRGITVTMNRGALASILAQNTGYTGTITCRITIDGVVISTNTSSGIARCSGNVG